MRLFTPLLMSALIAIPASAALKPAQPDLGNMIARKGVKAGFGSDRISDIMNINDKMFKTQGPQRAAAVPAEPVLPTAVGPTSHFGDIDGPDGKIWFYTLDVDYEVINHEAYDEYVSRHWVLNIFDSENKPYATLEDDVHYTDGEKRTVILEPLQLITSHYFNQDDKYEIAMSFGYNWQPGHNHYRTLIYQIDGEKDEKGYDKSIYQLDELIADVAVEKAANGENEYYMTLIRDHAYIPEEFDWGAVTETDDFWSHYTRQDMVFEVYKKAESDPTPELILTKAVPFANFPGTQEMSPLLSVESNGNAYMVFSYYKEPFFNPFYSWSEDPSQREENALVIDIYKLGATSELVQTTEIPFSKNDESLLAKYFSIGDLRYNGDVNFNDFTTDGKAAFYVREARQKRGTEDPDYFIFYVYGPDGQQIKKVFEGAENHISMANLDGFEPQECFITYEYGEYNFNMVDLISCKKAASFSNMVEIDDDSDPESITANIDRVKTGKTYKYAAEMRMPIDVDDYTWMRIMWLNNKGNYDHTDYVNMGANVHYAMCYLDEAVLNPNIYHSDDNMEYMMLVKRGIWEDDAKTKEKIVEELLIAQAVTDEYPDGRDLLRLGAHESGAPISNIMPYTMMENPKLQVSYYHSATNKYYCESYSLPLDLNQSGINAPVFGDQNVEFDGDKVSVSGMIEVYNLQGMRVAAGNGNIDLSNLPKGVYIVKSEKGTTKIYK